MQSQELGDTCPRGQAHTVSPATPNDVLSLRFPSPASRFGYSDCKVGRAAYGACQSSTPPYQGLYAEILVTRTRCRACPPRVSASSRSEDPARAGPSASHVFVPLVRDLRGMPGRSADPVLPIPLGSRSRSGGMLVRTALEQEYPGSGSGSRDRTAMRISSGPMTLPTSAFFSP